MQTRDYEFLVAQVHQLEGKFGEAQNDRVHLKQQLATQGEQLAAQAIMLKGFVAELADLKAKRAVEQSQRVVEAATQAAVNSATESAMSRLNDSLCSAQVQHQAGSELWVVLI